MTTNRNDEMRKSFSYRHAYEWARRVEADDHEIADAYGLWFLCNVSEADWDLPHSAHWKTYVAQGGRVD